MEDEALNIRRLQIRRGTQAALEKKLVGDDKPLQGELLFELPTEAHPGGRMKIGDGLNDYTTLPYMPDSIDFTKWISQAQESAIEAANSKNSAKISETNAASAMQRAEEAADIAKKIPETTTTQVNNYMNQKLHFMSMAEYNKLTTLDPDGYYFLSVED